MSRPRGLTHNGLVRLGNTDFPLRRAFMVEPTRRKVAKVPRRCGQRRQPVHRKLRCDNRRRPQAGTARQFGTGRSSPGSNYQGDIDRLIGGEHCVSPCPARRGR